MITYWELYRYVNRLANAMKNLGIKKGDRVAIYIPMMPEAVVAMLACARIGAVHSVVFGGFSAKAWMWYYKYIGHERCPVVDTWWQTDWLRPSLVVANLKRQYEHTEG